MPRQKYSDEQRKPTSPELSPEERTELESIAEKLKEEACDTCFCRERDTTSKVAECNVCLEDPVHIDLEMDPIHDEQLDPAYLFDRAPDMEREISETVIDRREYLDRIDQLLDLMAPECRKNPLLKIDTMNIVRSILDQGFAEEVRKEAGA